jgi:lambda family phage portal protein
MPGRDESYERIPADEIFHLRIVERWPQTRGVPWMHTVLRKLDSLAEYSQLEVDAARAGAAYFGTITTPEDQNPLKTAEEDSGEGVMDIDPLTIQALAPGEQLQFHTPNRPNAAFDGFFRTMLREVAVGTCTSYASLSSDHSQSNYSSSRLAMLDDRDTWRALQQWWIRSFRAPLHAMWMRQAALAGAIPSVPAQAYGAEPDKFTAALFKPRGWSWVDPTKEVAAYKEAIKAGITTLTDVIAATGGGQDIEDVVATRRRELDLLEANDIPSDVGEPEEVAPPMPAAPAPKADDEDDADDPEDTPAPARGRVLAMNSRTA